MFNIEKAKERVASLSGNENLISGGSLCYGGEKYGLGGNWFEPTQDFEFKLCEVIKVPHSLFHRCSGELKGHLLTEFAAGEDRFGLLVRGGKVDSLLKARDMFVPIDVIFNALCESVGQDAEFDHINLSKGVYEFETVTARGTEIRPGDVSRGGVLVQVGQLDGLNYRIAVSSYIYRLVCQNGLQRRESENAFVLKRAGSQEEIITTFRTLVNQTVEAVYNRYLPEFAQTAVTPTRDPATLIRVIAKEALIPAELVDGLLDLIPTLPESPTVYDVVNLVTNFANRNEWARRKLLTAGGRMVDQTIERCNHCHKAL